MIRRVLILGVLALFVILLLGRIAVPSDRGDPGTTGSWYIERSVPELGAWNVVTAIVVAWRGLDTLGEVSVLFLAAAGIALLLRAPGPDRGGAGTTRRDSSEILRTGADVLAPALVFFGCYIFMGGHLTPGGGFQGGVILGASFIMIAIAYNLRVAIGWLSPKLCVVFAALGVALYGAIGFLCLLLGGDFLDYGVLSRILPLSAVEARSMGILGVEIGVACTVMAVMFSIYADLSSQGRLYRGL